MNDTLNKTDAEQRKGGEVCSMPAQGAMGSAILTIFL